MIHPRRRCWHGAMGKGLRGLQGLRRENIGGSSCSKAGWAAEFDLEWHRMCLYSDPKASVETLRSDGVVQIQTFPAA